MKKIKYCKNCNKILTQKQKVFCCSKCVADYKYKEYIKRWKNNKENGIKGQYGISEHIRRYLMEKNNYKCQNCGWGKVNKNTGKIPLEVHHVDGDYKNNKENNLELLCPNCHSLTSNYKSSNKNGRQGRKKYILKKQQDFCIDCGEPVYKNANRCKECNLKHKVDNGIKKRITRNELKQLIRQLPFTHIAKKYDVSDNAIKKWCKSYNLPYKKIDINSISDEDWELL